jgi:hypothetical protein
MHYHSLYSHEATVWTLRVSNTGGGKRLFLKSSGLALGPTEYSTELTRGPFPGGQNSRRVNLTTYLHLLPMLRMIGTIPLLSFMP